MIRTLSGLALGYFIYTQEGREYLSKAGKLLVNITNKSMKELNSFMNNNNKKEIEYVRRSKELTEKNEKDIS